MNIYISATKQIRNLFYIFIFAEVKFKLFCIVAGSLQKEIISTSQHQFFFCTECQKEFLFTNTEILKHKRNHKNFPKV